MCLSKKLGNLHNEFMLLSIKDFQKSLNILATMKTDDRFGQLTSFYDAYKTCFTMKSSKKVKSPKATNVDLPFIGQNVIDKSTADFIFYFEGSHTKKNSLSITVLAFLWLIENSDTSSTIDTYCGTRNYVREKKWWCKEYYLRIRDMLKIPPDILSKSYICDSNRLTSTSKNTDLIYKEIDLLKPKLVICFGSTARNLVGMKYLQANTKFHHVVFPSNSNKNKGKGDFSNLRDILNRLK
jgi:hypothetical protein